MIKADLVHNGRDRPVSGRSIIFFRCAGQVEMAWRCRRRIEGKVYDQGGKIVCKDCLATSDVLVGAARCAALSSGLAQRSKYVHNIATPTVRVGSLSSTSSARTLEQTVLRSWAPAREIRLCLDRRDLHKIGDQAQAQNFLPLCGLGRNGSSWRRTVS